MEEAREEPMENGPDITDIFDPRRPGYLARSRIKRSMRTRLPRLEGARIPRQAWSRFSSVRRYLPVSVLTVMAYVFLLRIMMLHWGLLFNETMFIRFWSSHVMAGVSMLGWFEVLNVVMAVWVALDFFVASRDRRRIGRGQKWGYIAALVLLGAMQLAYNHLDRAADYLRVLTVLDDHAHPSLMLRIPPEQEPNAALPMTFEQCPVGLALLDRDPNWGNIYNFFKWETQGPNRFKRPGDPNLFPAMDMPAEMRRRAATARPPWLLIDPTHRSDLSWREVVEVCDVAFDAGFERVFLRDSKPRSQAWGGSRRPSPDFKSGVFYSVAEVLPVEPTRWRQGAGRENRGAGLVRVWAITEGFGPLDLATMDPYVIGPSATDIHVRWYWVDHEGEVSGEGLFDRFDPWGKEMIAREIRWRRDHGQRDLALWIWADGRLSYKDLAPMVDMVSQEHWDPNGR